MEPHALLIAIVVGLLHHVMVCSQKIVLILNERESFHQDSGQNCHVANGSL